MLRADCIERSVDRAIVAEKLDRPIWPVSRAEADRDRILHELLNVVGQEVARPRGPGETLTIVAIEHEAQLDDIAVPTTRSRARPSTSARWRPRAESGPCVHGPSGASPSEAASTDLIPE